MQSFIFFIAVEINQLDLKLKDGKFLNINLYEIKVDNNIIDNNTLLDAFFFGCQCALFLVDITNPNYLKNLKKLIILI